MNKLIFIAIMALLVYGSYRSLWPQKRRKKWRDYIIRKGRHAANIKPRSPFNNGTYIFNFKLTESCIYDLGFDEGWSKLSGIHGLKFKWSKEYKRFIWLNSCRLGWRCTNGKIRLAMYCYIDGVRHIKEFVSVDVDIYDDTRCAIVAVPHGFKMQLTLDAIFTKTKPRELYEGSTKKMNECVWIKHYLYFGGIPKAPHKIEIKIYD